RGSAAASLACRRSGFFFQAEDGIRDFHVTGVQTCALPILGAFSLVARVADVALRLCPFWAAPPLDWGFYSPSVVASADSMGAVEIGRASCRERVWRAVGGGAVTRVWRGWWCGRTDAGESDD